MANLLDVITDALGEVGNLGVGQPLSNEDAALALRCGNRILDEISNLRLALYSLGDFSITVPATQNHTLGPTGSIARTPRPTLVKSAGVIIPGTGQVMPLNLPDANQWAAIRGKTAVDLIPSDLFINYTATNLALSVWPIPSGAVTVKMITLDPFSEFTSIATTLTFPPGYRMFLKNAMVVELAPHFGQPVTPTMLARKQEAFAGIQTINAEQLGGAFGESRTLANATVGEKTLQPKA